VIPFSVALTLRRHAPGEYVNGIWHEDGQETDTTIRGSMQPLNGNERMDLLPEGRRNCDSVKIFTDVQARPARQDDGQNADIILAPSGREYEVISCEPWTLSGTALSHFRIIGMKLGEP
jgi:hypothetical protein